MRLWQVLAAELRKIVTLPAAWVGAGVALLGSAAITLLNSVGIRAALAAGEPERLAFTSPFEAAFAAMPISVVGAVVIGVVAMSSEYTANSTDVGGGRQISATLAATPQRIRVLVAKAVTVALCVVAVAAVTLPATVGLAGAVIGAADAETVTLGEAVVRCLGGALYATLMGLIAFATTVVARSGIIPLIVFIVNSSLVSVSFLLTRVTPLAHWLPDVAGLRLFSSVDAVEGALDAVPGALVMGAWTLAFLVVAAIVFSRRDA
jgi:ABC-2 type transport system permease protein